MLNYGHSRTPQTLIRDGHRNGLLYASDHVWNDAGVALRERPEDFYLVEDGRTMLDRFGLVDEDLAPGEYVELVAS